MSVLDSRQPGSVCKPWLKGDLRRLAPQWIAMSRRETRQRKVSQKIGALSDADKQQAASARLQALELDEPIGALQEDISDDEFLAEGSDEGAPAQPELP